MANTKSARKMIRVTERRRQHNRPIRSAVRTQVGKAKELVANGELEAGKAAVDKALRALDKGAQKGIIHRNNAARRKSRLMKGLNTAMGEATAPDQEQAK